MLALALGSLAAAHTPAAAGAAWGLRSYPQGSGSLLSAAYPGTAYLLGEFGDGREMTISAGGDIMTVYREGPPFGADSVVSFTTERSSQFVVSRSGSTWLGDDYGRHWRQIAMPDSIGIPATWMAVHNGDRILLGTRDGRLYASPNTRFSRATRIASFDSTAVRSILSDGYGEVLIRLDDGRLAIEHLGFSIAPFRVQCIDMARTPFGFALDSDSLRIWMTQDAGRSWAPISPAPTEPAIRSIVSRARGMALSLSGFGALACGDVLLLTDDAGRSWRVGATGPDLFHDATIDADDKLVTSGAQLHRSRDGGASVEVLCGADFSEVLMGDAEILWTRDSGLLCSTTHGDAWRRIPLPIVSSSPHAAAAFGGDHVWVHFEDGGTSTFRSTDQGSTFEAIDPGGALAGLLDWEFATAEVGWAAAGRRALRSEDGGATWAPVLEAEAEIDAIAARDSAAAVVVAGETVSMTEDGGSRWEDVTVARLGAERVEDAAVVSAGRCVIAGDGLTLIDVASGVVYPAFRADVLFHAVTFADAAIGWAVDEAGDIHGTTDGGRSWTIADEDLHVASVAVPLRSIDSVDRDHAVTGAPGILIRRQPDMTAPIFRMIVAHNPYLTRYLDIDVSAKERLLNDSLRVQVDGTAIHVVQFDAEGFLFRARYQAPDTSASSVITIRGKDLAGNERFERREIGFVRLRDDGRAALGESGPWLVGSQGQRIAFLEVPDTEAPPPAGGLHVWLVATAERVTLEHADRILVCREDGGGAGSWLPVAGGDPVELRQGDRIALESLRVQEGGAPDAAAVATLRVVPVPARDRIILRMGSLGVTLRYRMFDLAGRNVLEGSIARGASEAIVPLRDAHGRALAAGVYWLRVTDRDAPGTGEAIRRVVVLQP